MGINRFSTTMLGWKLPKKHILELFGVYDAAENKTMLRHGDLECEEGDVQSFFHKLLKKCEYSVGIDYAIEWKDDNSYNVIFGMNACNEPKMAESQPRLEKMRKELSKIFEFDFGDARIIHAEWEI